MNIYKRNNSPWETIIKQRITYKLTNPFHIVKEILGGIAL